MKKWTCSHVKIKTILLMLILTLALIPLVMSAIGSSFILKKNNEKTFVERGNSLNNIVENTIIDRISQYEQLLESIVANGHFDSEEYITNELIPDMKLIENSNEQIINVYFAMNDGRFIQTSDGELPEGFDARNMDWYIQGVKYPENRMVERPYQDSVSNEMITTVYKTVKLKDTVYGILAVDVKLNDLSDALSMIKYGEKGELIVADPENSMVVFCGDESKVGNDEPSQYSIWNKIKDNESGNDVLTYEGVDYEIVYRTSSILNWKIILKEPQQDLNHSIFNIIINNIINIAILAVISISIAIIFAKKMSNVIIDLTNHIEIASQGKFNIEIKNKPKTYELVTLTDSFNHMLRNIADLLTDVDNSIDIVNTNSNEAYEISRQISESIEQVSETIGQISQGNVESSENLEDISEKISDLSSSMNNITAETQGADMISKNADDLSIHGIKMIDLIKEKSSVTKLNSEEVKAVVYDVAKSVEEISNMNSAISNIAEQTNLLALNAAIEAARAGESGRGFAVVADEIVKLADEAGKSARQIELMVNTIKEKTNNAVEKVNETTELVISQEEAIDQSGEVFGGISDSVKELTNKISIIRDEVLSVNTLKDDVLEKVENLSAIFEETAAGSEEVTASAEEVAATTETFMGEFYNLKDTVDNLNEKVSKFEFE